MVKATLDAQVLYIFPTWSKLYVNAMILFHNLNMYILLVGVNKWYAV